MILVTGGTGLIGQNVLQRLAVPAGGEVAVLTRRAGDPAALGCGAMTAIAGDLRLPGLGVSERIRQELEARITGILHCAAEIRFDLPIDEARAVNVDGTRQLLALARRCPRLDRFAHVSTTYVAGRSPEPLPEGRHVNSHGFFSSYQQSKYEAEELVLAEAGSLPVAIYRLSAVIGDSQSGRVQQHNSFHQLVRLARTRGDLVTMLPGCSSAAVDVMPSDWAASAIAWLFGSPVFESGVVRNLCAGPRGAIPIQELLTNVFQGPGPELVSGSEFQRYLETRDGRRVQQRLLPALEHLLPYFSIRQQFQNERTNALLEHSAGLPPFDSRQLLTRVLGHLQ